MPEIGEEIVGAYLKECLKCDFVEYSYDLGEKQAECDVVGIEIAAKKIYFCEVATHTRGFLYVNQKTRQPDNYERLVRKFTSVVRFARKRFSEFDQIFMFWSPIVRESRATAKHDALKDVQAVVRTCNLELRIDLRLVVNDDYLRKLQELRNVAREKGADSPFSIIRFLQIEEKLRKHLDLAKK
jgi:hypothetical protein